MVAPVLNSKWQTDEYNLNKFALNIEGHRARDESTNATCKYRINTDQQGSFSEKEYKAMIKNIPDVFLTRDKNWLNQHYDHSLQQLMAEFQQAYNNHIERTNAIIGTPAGNISDQTKCL